MSTFPTSITGMLTRPIGSRTARARISLTLRRVACDCGLVAFGADGELVFTSPGGRGLPSVPPRERVGDNVTWLREWADTHGVHPRPDSNMPRWDGHTPDYDCTVSWLLAAG